MTSARNRSRLSRSASERSGGAEAHALLKASSASGYGTNESTTTTRAVFMSGGPPPKGFRKRNRKPRARHLPMNDMSPLQLFTQFISRRAGGDPALNVRTPRFEQARPDDPACVLCQVDNRWRYADRARGFFARRRCAGAVAAEAASSAWR